MIANRSVPRCTVIPELAYPDVADASEWLCGAFGFTVRLRIADHRVQLNVGDGAIVVKDAGGAMPTGASGGPGDRSHSVMVRVDDVDGHCRQSTGFGARLVNPPQTYPFGERHIRSSTRAATCGRLRSRWPTSLLKIGVGHPWRSEESTAESPNPYLSLTRRS